MLNLWDIIWNFRVVYSC